MGQKKIKRSKTEGIYIDPSLEQVEEDRAFDIEYDEEDNEAVLVNHYRRKWDDGFDADVEHRLNIEEAKALVAVLNELIELMIKVETSRMVERIGDKLQEKSTILPVEKNPLKDNLMQ